MRRLARIATLMTSHLLLFSCEPHQPTAADRDRAIRLTVIALEPCSKETNHNWSVDDHYDKVYNIAGIKLNEALSKVQTNLLLAGFKRTETTGPNSRNVTFWTSDHSGAVIFLSGHEQGRNIFRLVTSRKLSFVKRDNPSSSPKNPES